MAIGIVHDSGSLDLICILSSCVDLFLDSVMFS